MYILIVSSCEGESERDISYLDVVASNDARDNLINVVTNVIVVVYRNDVSSSSRALKKRTNVLHVHTSKHHNTNHNVLVQDILCYPYYLCYTNLSLWFEVALCFRMLR